MRFDIRGNGEEREASQGCEEQRSDAQICCIPCWSSGDGTGRYFRGREEKIHLESSLATWARTLLTRTCDRAVDSGCGVVV